MRPKPRYLTHVRYYFVDFGVSLRFEGDAPHLATGTICRDPTAPELSNRIPFDPFMLDVYLLGNFFLTDYVEVRRSHLGASVSPATHNDEPLQKYNNLEFLRPLLVSMTQRNPSARPTAEEALQRLRDVARVPSGISYRWRLRPRDEHPVKKVVSDIRSLFHEGYLQLRYCFNRQPLSFGRP